MIFSVACMQADQKDQVSSLISAVCIDSLCVTDKEVQFVRSHRQEAIPILAEALQDRRKFDSPGLIGFWAIKLAPYKDTTVIVDSLVKLTKDPDEGVSGYAYEVLAAVAGTGDEYAKKQVIPQIRLTLSIARGLEGSQDEELKKLEGYLREILNPKPQQRPNLRK